MSATEKLTEFEQSMVALAISAATAFSLPKSVGAMFGLTFASAKPLGKLRIEDVRFELQHLNVAGSPQFIH